MDVITWKPEYELGIQEIDEQHKKLVNLINDFYMAIVRKRSAEEVGRVIHEVVDYTRIHFAIEECLLRLFEYEDYAAHKKGHDLFVEKVMHIKQRFLQGDSSVSMELFSLLRDWLIQHIQEKDAQYAPVLLKRGVKKSWLQKFW
ncbi:bacteriohemerythrin [Azovibrio restrictus]|uniref:bacteriohemerythrin n=1 Tax=Azovibrio restrictus TaxID=146938 RepID=UPI0026F003D1|nr:bacteriohemerythrin [Azovibrio restrictus]